MRARKTLPSLKCKNYFSKEVFMQKIALQDQYAPHSICFGCGPANTKGLKIKSFPEGNSTVADWTPESHHEAFPGMLNGGIIGSLLDCHSNWTAAWSIMNFTKQDAPPCTVTAEYSVQLMKPTPSGKPVHLKAIATEVSEKKAFIEAELWSDDELCARCKGLFIAVKPGHPAYHRWG